MAFPSAVRPDAGKNPIALDIGIPSWFNTFSAGSLTSGSTQANTFDVFAIENHLIFLILYPIVLRYSINLHTFSVNLTARPRMARTFRTRLIPELSQLQQFHKFILYVVEKHAAIQAPDTIVVVLGVFSGALSFTRSFPWARPYRRVELALTPLSSRNTSEAARIVHCVLLQTVRLAFTSARSRSLACTVFFYIGTPACCEEYC